MFCGISFKILTTNHHTKTKLCLCKFTFDCSLFSRLDVLWGSQFFPCCEWFQNGCELPCNMLCIDMFSRVWTLFPYWRMGKGDETKPPWTFKGWKWFGCDYGQCKLENGGLSVNKKGEPKDIAPLKILGWNVFKDWKSWKLSYG